MRMITKAGLLLLVLGTAACTSPDRFGGGGNSVDLNGATGLPGSVDDPTSPAYFSQAIGDRVLFTVDQSTLTQEAMLILSGQAQWLFDNPEYLAVIEGHADEQGTREYNVALGARRANAVREFLVSKGVPTARIRTVSFGKERPISLCSDETCYSQNRRAVTVISIGQLS